MKTPSSKLTLEDLLVKFVTDSYMERPNGHSYKHVRAKAKAWIAQQEFSKAKKARQTAKETDELIKHALQKKCVEGVLVAMNINQVNISETDDAVIYTDAKTLSIVVVRRKSDDEIFNVGQLLKYPWNTRILHIQQVKNGNIVLHLKQNGVAVYNSVLLKNAKAHESKDISLSNNEGDV